MDHQCSAIVQNMFKMSTCGQNSSPMINDLITHCLSTRCCLSLSTIFNVLHKTLTQICPESVINGTENGR